MASEVDICNRALSIIGARSTIASLTESSTEAVQCTIHYASTRDELLRPHLWSFARRQVTMALMAAAAGTAENPAGVPPLPMAPWLYQYRLPTDCLRVRQLYQPASNGPKIAFSLSGDQDAAGNPVKVLLTNQPQAVLVYTSQVTVVDMFDPDFQAALVASLAARLAFPLTGDKSSAQYFAKVAADTILTARSIDGTEDPAGAEKLPEWLTVRGYSDVDTSTLNALLR